MANIFFIIPAGGVGTRMQADRPKQYLPLNDQNTVLEQTLKTILSLSGIKSGVIGISKEDDHFGTLNIKQNHLRIYDAGKTRSETVFLGLQALKDQANAHDWVIVHDAARPGLSTQEFQQFITESTAQHDSIGGIMALASVDTVKQVSHDTISHTIDRKTIYLAQTPQIFRFKILFEAYKQALEQNLAITDESSAVELLGYQPRIYQGYPHNFKITHPADLHLMQFILKERQSLCE